MRRLWLRGCGRGRRRGYRLLRARGRDAADGGCRGGARSDGADDFPARRASVDLQDSFGVTALMFAALRGHTTITQALLDAKADASLQDTRGSTALVWAEWK